MSALPQIKVKGVDYFIDFRLEEIRPVNMPFISIYFDDLDDSQKKAIRGIRAERGPNAYIKTLDN